MVVIFDRRNGVGKSIVVGWVLEVRRGLFLWNKIRKLLDNVAGV